jgi:hypothetical protein
METKEELMGRILTANAEQAGDHFEKMLAENDEDILLLKEDGATPLKIEAAQDYINELEGQVKVLTRSKASVVERLDEYQGENGPYILFKDMLLKALDSYDVMDVIKDEVLDGQPDIEDIEYRVTNLEDEKRDDYDIIDTVVDSTSFEDSVADIVIDKLSEVKFKVTIEE